MFELTTVSFDCARTCPANRTHWCRFNALFRLIGAPRVHSHTVRIRVEYTDSELLEMACKNLGWQWHGQGKHKLYDGIYTGHGFTPQGWSYPAVFANGEIHADTFGGRWGEDSQLLKLKAEYMLASAQNAASVLGWNCERNDAGLTIYHPEQGTLTISKDGVCETNGFVGSGCHAAREALGILADGAAQNKPEYAQTEAQIQLPG